MLIKKKIKKIALTFTIIAMLSIGFLVEGKVDAAGGTINMGVADWKTSDTYQLNDLTVTSSTSIKTVIVEVNKGAVVLATTPNGVKVVSDLYNRVYTFVYNTPTDATTVQSLLRGITFTYEEGQTVKITVDGNTTSLPWETDIKITEYSGHYYMFVPDTTVGWSAAYNKAKKYSYLGRQGYLATITSKGEDDTLINISKEGAWSGGTRALYLNNKPINNEYDIEGSNLYLSAPGNDYGKSQYYWACGPETGQRLIFENWNLSSNEPNNYGGNEGYLQVNYINQKWNDLADATNSQYIHGYFVEFGGYANNTDPGFVNGNTGVSIAEATFSLEKYEVKPFDNIKGATISNLPNTIIKNQDLIFDVSGVSGWTVDKKDISITVGGQQLTEGQYTYANGKVTVNGQYITGAVKVNVTPSVNWYTSNSKALKDALAKTSVDKNDNTNLNTLNNGWISLTDDQKAYIAAKENTTVAAITTKLSDLAAASNYEDTYRDKIDAIQSVKPDTDLKDWESANTAYNALSSGAQSYVESMKIKLDNINTAKTFASVNKDLYDAKTVSLRDYDKLNDALNNYGNFNKDSQALAKDVYDNLKKKADAVKMLSDHKDIISKKDITDKDKTNINAAINAYNALSEEKKKLIDENGSLKKELEAKLKAADWYTENNKNNCLEKPVNDLSSADLKDLLNANTSLNADENKDINQFISEDVKDRLKSAISTKNWNDTNKNILDKKTVTKDDLAKVNEALAEYNKLDDVAKKLIDPAIVENLEDKKATSEMLADNKILDKEIKDMTHDDLADLTKAVDAYDKLTANQKALVDDATKAKINAAKDASKWLADKKDIIEKETVTAKDVDTVEKALADYNKLDDNAKKLIDPAIVKNLEDKKATSEMLADNKILDKEIKDMTHDDLANLNKAVDAYDALTADQKALVDDATKAKINAAKDALKWLADKKDIIEKETVTAKDVDTVEKALADYDKLDGNAKKLIDPAIVKDLEDKKATSEMLAGNKILDKEIKDMTHDDLTDLKKAVDAYDALTNDQKALVDDATKAKIEVARDASKWLNDNDSIIKKGVVNEADLADINNAIQSYENLSDEAKGLIDQNIVNNLYDKKNVAEWSNTYNEMITKDPSTITADDLLDLRDAMDAYNNMTNEEKALVDSSVIKNLIDSQSNAFIKSYISDKNGNMYTKVTGQNYEQILSGKSDWEKMSQDEKDAINAIIKNSMGKTYEELIAESETIQKAQEDFINKYLTGKDKVVYKEATKENYKQILSGLEAWNKLTQEEKDAINAKLVANGGKTYEELIKSAEAIKAKINAGDTTNAQGLSMMLILSMACIILIYRKKEIMN